MTFLACKQQQSNVIRVYKLATICENIIHWLIFIQFIYICIYPCIPMLQDSDNFTIEVALSKKKQQANY